MSYIPPHKRHSKDPVRPTPVPESLITNLKKRIGHFKSTISPKDNICTYSRYAISKWLLVGSYETEDLVPPPSLKLVPVSSDSSESRYGKNSLVLINNDVEKENMMTNKSEEEEEERSGTRWILVADKLEEDLVFAYEQGMKKMEDHNHQVHIPNLRLVARFGKLIFFKNQAGLAAESSLRNVNKTFSTNVPASYIQNVTTNVVQSHDFSKDEEKERYFVKISHYTSPHVNILCKCTVKEDGRLSFYKVELNLIRHLVVDVSCVDKNLDMRLMLSTKRKMMGLTEKEISNIKELLHSATVNPKEKGGLRWPLGSTSTREGYRVFETCHVRSTVYKSQTIRLRVRETDRYNERVGAGETKREVALMLKDINTKMQKQNTNRACVSDMLRDALGTLWNFLHCDAYLS
ncbi:unnamed protein product [Cochlearia groenlandica]